jgi:hypothetical protein
MCEVHWRDAVQRPVWLDAYKNRNARSRCGPHPWPHKRYMLFLYIFLYI